MFSSQRFRAALLCAAVLLQGCVTGGSLQSARSQFYSGQPHIALETLSTEKVSKRNRLLARLDQGLIAHTAGEYQESINAFKSAYDLLEKMDFISISEQSASLVVNDWVTSYKAEYSERLWIHTFQMMNFLLINKPEGAAVEARQALKIYAKHGDTLKHDWYTRTLMAMSFAAAGKPDSAHIEFKKLINDIDRDVGVARRAWQNARSIGREDDALDFKNLVTTTTSTNSQEGELVLFLQTGSIPRKIAGEVFLDPSLYASFPVYPNVPRSNVRITAFVNGANKQADIVTTQLVDVSRSALAARGKKIAAKQILRIAAKRELARALEKRADGFGGLITAFLFLTEQADTRSWETLPAQVSMVQIPLSAGTHDVKVLVQHQSREYELAIPSVSIQSRKITYRSIRVGQGAPRLVTNTALNNTSLNLPNL